MDVMQPCHEAVFIGVGEITPRARRQVIPMLRIFPVAVNLLALPA
jgi:hypothetical protein